MSSKGLFFDEELTAHLLLIDFLDKLLGYDRI